MPSGQAELPFEPPLTAGRRGLGTRIRQVVVTARSRPAAATLAALGFVIRWALRLGLPLGGAAAMLHLFPYRTTAGGIRFQIQATLFKQPGITADTTFGSWIFGHVDGLPIGVHIRPENVDVVRMSAAATSDPQAYVDALRADFVRRIPGALAWLSGEALVGVLLGLAVAAAINLAVRHVRELPRRAHELRHRAGQLLAVVVVLAVLGGYGAWSFDPNWTKRSHLTGTLAALQLFPGQLRAYYQQRATAFDVLSGITAIQAQLQEKLEHADVPPTAFNIMFVSDMHLAGTYPLLRQYAKNFDVSLIVNTGDEAQFGTAAEMTPEYLKQIRALTRIAPMIWIAGNHDSPTTVDVMSSIKGVTVLGTKTYGSAGGYEVGGQQMNAYGLQIAGVPDPRVYGAAGDYGSNTPSVVDSLERQAIDDAVHGVPTDAYFDIFATHEPKAAEEALKELPGQIRQTNSGHVHHQNANGDVQSGDAIDLVEGSSGAGGLKEVGIDVTPVPVEFSIESVAADCQFTKVVRFQVAGAGPTTPTSVAAAAENVTASTVYLTPQKMPAEEVCRTDYGIGPVHPLVPDEGTPGSGS